jgi:hypothetical protein
MRLNRTSVGLVALTLWLGAAAGCGPSTGSTPNSSGAGNAGGDQGAAVAAKNPCDLVSTGELAAILTKVDKMSSAPQVTQTKNAGEFQGRNCTWEYPRSETASTKAMISVNAWNGLDYYTPDVIGGLTEVSGIGDVAHAGPSMLMFHKGDDVFSVQVLGDSNGPSLRTEIGKLIVSKL